eukprot:c18527_g1_i1 orf=112-360(+)
MHSNVRFGRGKLKTTVIIHEGEIKTFRSLLPISGFILILFEMWASVMCANFWKDLKTTSCCRIAQYSWFQPAVILSGFLYYD